MPRPAFRFTSLDKSLLNKCSSPLMEMCADLILSAWMRTLPSTVVESEPSISNGRLMASATRRIAAPGRLRYRWASPSPAVF
jgi:hypothetical protein